MNDQIDSQKTNLLNESAARFLFEKDKIIIWLWRVWIFFTFLSTIVMFVAAFHQLVQVEATSSYYGDYQASYRLFISDWDYSNGTWNVTANENFNFAFSTMLWAQSSGSQNELVVCQTMWGIGFLVSLFSILRALVTLFHKDIQRVYQYWGYLLTSYVIQIVLFSVFYEEWKGIPSSLYYVFPSNYTTAIFLVDDDLYDDDLWLDDEVLIVGGWSKYPQNPAKATYSSLQQIDYTIGVLLTFIIVLCVTIVALKVKGDQVLKAIATTRSISHSILDREL